MVIICIGTVTHLDVFLLAAWKRTEHKPKFNWKCNN